MEDDELGIVADVGEAELSGDGGEQVIDSLDYPLGFGRHQPSVNADCQVLQQSFMFGHLGLKIRFVDKSLSNYMKIYFEIRVGDTRLLIGGCI